MKISACTFDCPDSCSWLVDPEQEKIIGNPQHPFTQGFSCPKGSRLFKRLNAPDRITRPLLRDGDSFRPISWDDALNLCAEKLDALRETPERILHLRGFGYRGILGSASITFFNSIGATRTRGALCDDTGIEACIADFGSLNHNDPADLLNAQRIVNWGKDFNRSSIHTAALIRKARKQGTQVLSISIGGDNVAALSDHVIRIRPGTDRFLAAAVAKQIMESGKASKRALARTANSARFFAVLENEDMATLLRGCGATADDMRLIADGYTCGDAVSSVIGWGVQRHVHGGESVRFINALTMLSGTLGTPGCGVYYNISSGRSYTKWKAQGSHDGPTRTFLIPKLADELRSASPAIEFCWIDGFNAANQVPDAKAAAQAIEAIPFTVAVEAFMNDTAMRADLILPPALTLEREDILGSALHNYVNISAKLLEPRGEARSDFDMLADLGSRLSQPIRFPSAEECFRLAFAESAINLEELREKGFARGNWPHLAYEGWAFDHPDGLYRFPETLSEKQPADPQWPLALMSLVRKEAIHSQIDEDDQQKLLTARIAPDNPMLAGLNMDRPAFIVTPVGRLQVKLETVEGIHPEVVIMRRGGWLKHGRNPNAIIEQHVTDMGGGAAYYSQRCRLENGE